MMISKDDVLLSDNTLVYRLWCKIVALRKCGFESPAISSVVIYSNETIAEIVETTIKNLKINV
jgi:hypothetical protein